MLNKFKHLLTILTLSVLSLSAQAGPIVYTDEASFLSAIGGAADITEDFNSYTTDQSFRNSSFDVGPFTLSSSGTDQNTGTQNTIDASPFSFGNFSNVNNTTFAHFFIRGGVTTASITFDMGISAFGATFKELSNLTSIGFTTSSGAMSITPGIGLGVGFFGFTLDPGESITSLTFSRVSSGDGFGMDDVMLANAASVPEPGVLTLLALGFMISGFSQRKKS